MMKTPMLFFHMQEIVVTETMTAIHCVLITSTKSTKTSGKTVRPVKPLLILPITLVWERMNYNFEVLKNPEKFSISCVNCGFTTDTLDAFALQTSKGYYCTKKKCQKTGFTN